MTLELAVAGGGPAGAASACLLARAGRPVTLFDRNPGPRDVVCGDFISIEAQEVVAGLGIDLAGLGAVRIDHLRLVSGRVVARSRLPFTGLSLSRRVLDEALLCCAQQSGAVVRRGAMVREVTTAGRLVRLSLSDEEVEARCLLLATGKHEVRGAGRRTSRPTRRLIGFKTYLSLSEAQAAELGSHVEVLLFQGGYAGLQPVEGGRANLCLLVDESRLRYAGGRWDDLRDALIATVPHLGRRLAGARELLDRPLSIAQVPYGFVHRARPGDPPGIWRLGDQAGVIPSFCGDGVAIALESARIAAGHILAGDDALAHHERLRRAISGPIRLASALDGMAATAVGRTLLAEAARIAPRAVQAVARLTRVGPSSAPVFPQAARADRVRAVPTTGDAT